MMTNFVRPDTDEMLDAMYPRETVSAYESLRYAAVFVTKLIVWAAAGIAAVALILALSVGLISRVRTELAVTPEQAIAMVEAKL